MISREFIWPIRVYWEDTDASGVVYHANYLRWFERARTEWLRARGLSQEDLRHQEGVAFTVANLHVDYVRPARLDDELVIHTRVASAGRASIEFAQRLCRSGNGEELARLQARVACVDALSFKPRGLPASFPREG